MNRRSFGLQRIVFAWDRTKIVDARNIVVVPPVLAVHGNLKLFSNDVVIGANGSKRAAVFEIFKSVIGDGNLILINWLLSIDRKAFALDPRGACVAKTAESSKWRVIVPRLTRRRTNVKSGVVATIRLTRGTRINSYELIAVILVQII